MPDNHNLTPPTPINTRRIPRKKAAPLVVDDDPVADAQMAKALSAIEPPGASILDDRFADELQTAEGAPIPIDGVPRAFAAGMTDEEGPDEEADDAPRADLLRTNYDQADSLADAGRAVSREFVQAGPEIIAMRRNDNGDRASRTVNFDGLTVALGAKRWRDGAVFDWARMHDGRRFTFSKSYFEVGVLVDIFAARTPAVVREIAEKRAAIANYNTIAEHGFGYLPTIRDSIIPVEMVNAALAGEVLDLTQMQLRHDIDPVKFDEFAAAGGDIYEQAKMRGVV
jgi:hypothetical protein